MTSKATQPELGADALNAVQTTIKIGSNFHTGSRNLKGRLVWLPRWLVPVRGHEGQLAALNNDGFLIGHTSPAPVKKEWRFSKGDLDLGGLTPEPDGCFDLWKDCGAPWRDEFVLRLYLGSLAKVFGLSTKKTATPSGFIAGG